MSLLTFMYSFRNDMEEIQRENERKVDEAIDMYINASKFPRKKKKAVRKKANRDYSFWKGLSDWHKEQFTF